MPEPLPLETLIRRAHARLVEAVDTLTTNITDDLLDTEATTIVLLHLVDLRSDRMMRLDYVLALINVALESVGQTATEEDFRRSLDQIGLETYDSIDGARYVLGVSVPGLCEDGIDESGRAREEMMRSMMGFARSWERG